MATPAEEAGITYLPFITLITPKTILLNIPHTLQHKAQHKQNHASNIPPRPKLWLIIFQHIGTIQDGNGQRNGPNPNHLKDPKPKKGQELIPHLIESVIFARLEDSK